MNLAGGDGSCAALWPVGHITTTPHPHLHPSQHPPHQTLTNVSEIKMIKYTAQGFNHTHKSEPSVEGGLWIGSCFVIIFSFSELLEGPLL
jgi:hypothetical protein